jgi:hypothetical protein
LREGRTREVQTHDSISTVNPKENVDRRFGPGEFVRFRNRGKEYKQFAKVPKHKVAKGYIPRSSSMIISRREPNMEPDEPFGSVT